MATKTLPSFLSNPKRDQCTGRIASLARILKEEGYEARHIAFAAAIVAEDYARQEDLTWYRRFMQFELEHAQENLAATEQFIIGKPADEVDFFKDL